MTAPKPGDLVEVHWVDAAGSEGDPLEAVIAPTITPGYWVGWRRVRVRGKVERYAVTERNHIAINADRGWDATPAGMVRRVVVRRRA